MNNKGGKEIFSFLLFYKFQMRENHKNQECILAIYMYY